MGSEEIFVDAGSLGVLRNGSQFHAQTLVQFTGNESHFGVAYRVC